jgi:hypothetical protein
MTILIENAESLEYLFADSGWTKNAVDATAFPNTRIAFAAGKKQAIGKFNVVGYVPETRQLISLDHGRGSGAEAARS